MIDISVNEVATEVLIGAIGTAGRWLATAATGPRGRRAEDLSIARWFETYKLTDAVPDLPSISDSLAEQLVAVLNGDSVQGTLLELLAARLTDAPETEAARAREVFCLTVTHVIPTAPAQQLVDFYDDQICALVARLEAAEPSLLSQIRGEALSARMIAVLRAIERHTAALTAAPRDADTFLASYRRQAVENHGKLKPPDFDRRRLVPLADIYVPAVIYEEVSQERAVPSPQPPPPLTVWELIERADRSVLRGDPGGGKTTASNVLMHHLASDPGKRIPFLVTLRNFAASDPPEHSVVGYIERELETFYQCPAPPGLVEMLLLTGRAIVFFDGLDELLDTSRREDVATRVERFCTEYPLAPVLVTSRVVGYDQARLDDRQFTGYRLGGFSDDDVATYARKWFALDSEMSPEEADAFLSESESIPDLRSNPLLLSLMCILYRGEGSLPRNRAEIYEQCANLLFRRWDARRHIHQDLRAGHLLEPALRHLAWWLFTRSDTQSAVTERELVSASTEFLHGRGFESLDEARDAAREFIEFCRGRMWVFTDTGTTATGETLYSFTHRTFLEYFAAAQLAFGSDTPEELARTIAPHVARGEWEVVGELAVQIKDSTSTGGAKRVYEVLLGERRRRAPKGRSNILQFLAKSLRSVDPSPTAARRLTREILQFLFADDPNSPERNLPLAWLLASCSTNLATVDDEITIFISEAIISDDAITRIYGLCLAVSIDAPARTNWEDGPPMLDTGKLQAFWRNRKSDNFLTYRKEIVASAHRGETLLYPALWEGLIPMSRALDIKGGLLPFLQMQPFGILGLTWSPILLNYLRLVAYEEPGAEHAFPAKGVEIAGLTAAGTYLTTNPGLPWSTEPAFEWSAYFGSMNIKNDPPTLEPPAYFAGAAILLMSVESDKTLPVPFLQGDASQLGAFSDLYPYIVNRREPGSNLTLSDLLVPDEFKQVFRDWAAGKINFVDLDTGTPENGN